MYIKIENKEQGKRFTFFTKEREIKGEKVNHTDKSVFGTLSDGTKTGENNGKPIWENDYWSTTFCGKAYEKALTLKDKDKISVTEMNIRNIYSKPKKMSYPQIMVTDFELFDSNSNGDGFIKIPDNLEDADFNKFF